MEKKKNILIVDDEPDLLAVLDMRLRSGGYDVTIAHNGQEALTRIKERLPDLIITDVLMPQIDGFALYKELKKSKTTAEIPVIILTARGKMEDAFEAVGADDFLIKPFEPKVLMDKVAALLLRQETASILSPGKKVLLSGTDNEILENMFRQLGKAGCHVDIVTTGPQVISKVVLFLPAVIILEAQMDGMSTEEVVRVVRKIPQGEKVPVLIYSFYRLSDLGTEDVRQKALTVDSAVRGCLEAGATEYFGRFNESTFLKAVGKYLKDS